MSKINMYVDGLNIVDADVIETSQLVEFALGDDEDVDVSLEDTEYVDMTTMEGNDEIDMETGIEYGSGTRNYRALINLPTINGTILYDNYNEIDPTVPDWAKGEEPAPYPNERIVELWRKWFK